VTRKTPLLGAHVSVAGGVATAFDRGLRVGAEVIQIFTKHSTRWESKVLEPDEATAFREAGRRSGLPAVAVHAAYLINLGSSREAVRTRSLYALEDEAVRAHMLGIPYLVLHPGSSGDEPEEAGLARVGAALRSFGRFPPGVTLLLENTAGQGKSLGRTIEQLRRLVDEAGAPQDVAVCLDSAHLFAAGYDIAGDRGWNDLVAEMNRLAILPLVRMWHLNDSKTALGSRVDRHFHIGRGAIGPSAFRRIMAWPAFRDLPMVIETPKDGKDEYELDRANLDTLKELRDRPNGWREA
jgi:deoxyribonuclease IV